MAFSRSISVSFGIAPFLRLMGDLRGVSGRAMGEELRTELKQQVLEFGVRAATLNRRTARRSMLYDTITGAGFRLGFGGDDIKPGSRKEPGGLGREAEAALLDQLQQELVQISTKTTPQDPTQGEEAYYATFNVAMSPATKKLLAAFLDDFDDDQAIQLAKGLLTGERQPVDVIREITRELKDQRGSLRHLRELVMIMRSIREGSTLGDLTDEQVASVVAESENRFATADDISDAADQFEPRALNSDPELGVLPSAYRGVFEQGRTRKQLPGFQERVDALLQIQNNPLADLGSDTDLTELALSSRRAALRYRITELEERLSFGGDADVRRELALWAQREYRGESVTGAPAVYRRHVRVFDDNYRQLEQYLSRPEVWLVVFQDTNVKIGVRTPPTLLADLPTIGWGAHWRRTYRNPRSHMMQLALLSAGEGYSGIKAAQVRWDTLLLEVQQRVVQRFNSLTSGI